MFSNLHIEKFLIILIAFSEIVCKAHQPSYQVSLYVNLQSKEPPIRFCNGIIVQSRLILTTASCVHYKYSSGNSSVVAIEPGMISVVVESSTLFNEELTLQVGEIFVAANFNYTSAKNDLALLRLNEILPLDTRTDISWITLEDDGNYESPCLANFYVRNPPNGAPNYIQNEELPVLSPKSCKTASEINIERENDICSYYYLPAGFNCNSVEEIQNYNRDRGTGLVCGDKLIGLLSTIVPWQNITDCMEKPTKAFYTAIVPHINWIFNIIADEDLKMVNGGEYISSQPYAGETNTIVEPQSVTEYETTTGDYTIQTTEFLAQHNGAVLSKTNFKLLLIWIWGIRVVLHTVSC